MKTILFSIAIIIFSSCAKRIGDLTMIATRNVDSKGEYVELKRYVKSNGKTIEIAIDKAIKQVPGGEFMKNVTIYSNGKIEGDVWGFGGRISEAEKAKQIKTEQQTIDKKQNEAVRQAESAVVEADKAGYEIGDKVTYKDASKFNVVRNGVIISKTEEYAIIKLSSGDTVKIKYKILSKIN